MKYITHRKVFMSYKDNSVHFDKENRFMLLSSDQERAWMKYVEGQQFEKQTFDGDQMYSIVIKLQCCLPEIYHLNKVYVNKEMDNVFSNSEICNQGP